MKEVVIVDAARTPIGRAKADSVFASLHPADLLAQLLYAIVKRNGIDPAEVDDVITGCVSQVGEQSATPGRVAWLAAGFPEHVPSTTIDRKCGSSQQAVQFAAQAIMSGMADMILACGIESMSRVPMGSARLNANPYSPQFEKRYPEGLVSQGVAANLVAQQWRLSREDLDRYALRSADLALHAQQQGLFKREIVPIQVNGQWVDQDETIRSSTTYEGLSQLKAVFKTQELQQRFPELDWVTTAGNASQMSDGAAALLLMSREKAEALGLRPRARFAGFDVCGADPFMMLTAPMPSTQRLLKKTGIGIDAIDHFEVNEAFASVPLAWQKVIGAPLEKLNPRGGAIALGHPLGASGARLMVSLLHALEDNNQRMGLQTMCEAGGMANSTLLERL